MPIARALTIALTTGVTTVNSLSAIITERVTHSVVLDFLKRRPVLTNKIFTGEQRNRTETDQLHWPLDRVCCATSLYPGGEDDVVKSLRSNLLHRPIE